MADQPASLPRLVIVESPYAGDIERNTAYARAALADSLARGEAPFAPHLLYTQPGVLDDEDRDERAAGIEAGLAWGQAAEATVVYTDLGISDGMTRGIAHAQDEGRPVEYRTLPSWSYDGGCRMSHRPPYDFAWCRNHDTTFPLGEKCKFHGRQAWEVFAQEADEQRVRAVRAEHERDLFSRVMASAPHTDLCPTQTGAACTCWKAQIPQALTGASS